MKFYQDVISCYIRAKDDNKPHLMTEAFVDDAVLSMSVETENISFPSNVEGLDEITKTLVSDFSNAYQNVYTFCLSDTVAQNENTIRCRWLVCMSDKITGECRVGFGDYDWVFTSDGQKVRQLSIKIDDMLVLPREFQAELMPWVADLTYPWLSSSELVAFMPGSLKLPGLIP